MKFSFDDAARLAATSLLISTLAACGSSSSNKSSNNDDDDHDHEHDHGALIVSKASSTSLYQFHADDSAFEELEEGEAGVMSASFVRSDNGEVAAILGGSSIQFVLQHEHDEEEHEEEEHEEEEHEEEEHEEAPEVISFSLSGDQVLATNGHFSVLNAGSSTLVELDELAEDVPATESTSSLSVTETFPALVLDEHEDDLIVMVFDGTNAYIYEGANLEQTYACANPSSAAQGHHSAIVSCDAGTLLVTFEEHDGHLDFDTHTVTLNGAASDYMWQATEHVFAGYVSGSTDFALIHIDHDDHSVEEIIQGGDQDKADLSKNICSAGLEAEDGDFLFLLADGHFSAVDAEGELISNVVFDEAQAATCADSTIAISSKTAYVVDNSAMKVHEIDQDEGATAYHVHESFDITASDVANTVILFHQEESEDHVH